MLRMEAHQAFVTDIVQRPEEIVITLFERAAIDASGIPALIEKNKPYVSFTADAKRPAFHYFYTKNSRIKPKDVPELTMSFVKEVQTLALKQKS